MGRLIDATRIEQYILNNCSDNEEINAIYAEIINAPTVDAELVIRCKDCKWQITAYCPMPSWERKDNHYCYKGEREEDAD